MELEIVTSCPLGHSCEKVVDGKIHRCAWFTKLEGTNPQNGERVDESKCAMQWLPMLQVEGNGATHNVGVSIQSLRNETVSRQEKALGKINGLQISTD